MAYININDPTTDLTDDQADRDRRALSIVALYVAGYISLLDMARAIGATRE